jgi:Leucine-rich repeat (LRR) protein
MKIRTKILLLIIFFVIPLFIFGAIPTQERESLITFYKAANGDNWHVNTGWKNPPLAADGFAMPGTEGTWFGITVTGDHVTAISLDLNNLNGSMTLELGNLTSLEYLDLALNSLTGSIPAELGHLSSLKGVWLCGNQLSGSIPAELGNLKNLTRLVLSDTQLSDSIPPELGNLGKLSYLDLNNTQLSGCIPSELGKLRNLTTFILSDTQLSGCIPSELGNLSKLVYLDLSGAQLSGTIPPELGDLNNLEHLALYGNHLTGSIPLELGNLSNLNALFLSSNRLTGAVPTSLTNLKLLSYLNIGYNGLYTYDDTLRTFLTNLEPGWEDTQTIAPTNVSAGAVSDASIRVSWFPVTYSGDIGGYKVYYSTTPGGPWTYAGITADKSAQVYDVPLSPETMYYFVVKTQTNPHNHNKNTVVSDYSDEVSATTGSLEEKEPPFGYFDTPIDGSTVFSSIPVTGWALDNTGIDTVKIYRQQGISLVYIGDATLVEGARPDVAAAYPQYPNNTKAGWGYMMLTNFLPDGGNGTFVIYAIATDRAGNVTTLGTKTIHCDNANAVKPFGAIDTPDQGETASGSQFVNFGWVLTPLPNTIPTDGSTITVWVDSVPLGHPVYNQYRADIAVLFPGYNNSTGAVGYFYLDTTPYEDGVHTIQWTAADDAGNTDGIGSRYFTIQNTGESRGQGAAHSATGRVYRDQACLFRDNLQDIPIDYSTPVGIKKGYNQNIEPQSVYPGDDGTIYIEIRELERLEIHLDEGYEVEIKEKIKRSISSSRLAPGNTSARRYIGYLLSSKLLKELPIGSTFDSTRGVFCWNPGPGFIGQYRFIFVENGPGGSLISKNIDVKIIARF